MKPKVQAGQKSISSFFKKTNANDAHEDPAPASAEENEAMSDSDEPVVNTKKQPKKKSNASQIKLVKSADISNLPPIHEIPKIFDDMVSHIPQIKDVAQYIAPRKLRVATMCSGTESPLLALELIQKSILDQHGITLDIEHVFSCEIEPFKQAYIERNFHPPILFRDVCELGDDKAHTAYGALASVPGDVDMLIAGTSCVDYSNLNNEKQDIEANGESGRTFRGMMSWVTNHRPPIVVLENVCSAPWDKVREKFEKHGYSATYCRVDTKNYYIPHTRTRVYLMAVDQKRSEIPAKWEDLIKNKLKRQSSSTLDAFLLASDDPRIHQARQKLVRENYNGLDRRTGRTDWGRCESRHQRARLEEGLGAKRPLTSWDEGGFCKLFEHAWNDWGVGQVERVWDLMDISLLRAAKEGIDPSYKTTVWNLSQNVDRTIGSRLGICPCLTPSMIPYITNRGGPMVGLEALSMQGLPVDKLLLTRESEDQLADLAGNAMSTTVVGACMLAALVTAQKLIKGGDDTETYEMKTGTLTVAIDDNAMDVDQVGTDVLGVEDRVIGEDRLVYDTLDLGATHSYSFTQLLAEAEKSARLCTCEGRTDMTSRELLRCVDCYSSSCRKCGGRPEHNFLPLDLTANPRLAPIEFSNKLRSTLPMCMSLSNVTQSLLDQHRSLSSVDIPDNRWDSWSSTVIRVSQSVFRFADLKRQEIWSAVYRSPDAVLELLLHPQQPEWRLYGLAEDHEPVNAEIRRLLGSPIGRLVCKNGLLSGEWEFALPNSVDVNLTVKGVGELVPSWQARLGLTEDEFKNKSVWSRLQISMGKEDIAKFDRDVSGVYTLLDRCGTANGALHKQEEGDPNAPPIFLLFDPLRTSEEKYDSFVFSTSIRRYEFGESRPILGKLAPTWRQSDDEETQVLCTLPVQWIVSEAVKLQPFSDQDAQFGVPSQNLDISASTEECQSAKALLVCKVSLSDHAGPEWSRRVWQEVDKIHERPIFRALAWLLERVQNVGESFKGWHDVDFPGDFSNCSRCAPTPPKIEWVRVGKKVVAVEDPVQAGEYERRLKRRPSAFVTQLRMTDDNVGTVRIGLNIPSLLHRALSHLPSANRTETPQLSWRLDTNYIPLATVNLPKFVLKSNKLDEEHSQPPSFKIPLRKEQLRSLTWMISQESQESPPFMEEEIAEAILDPLGWRAEGRAQRPVHIQGGVLADQVGYGKTAITLGLIDCTSKSVDQALAKRGCLSGKIPVKATIVVVPPHLTRQWESEVKKFTGKRFKVLVISSLANLNSTTIEDVQEADIVVVAATLFKSPLYLENLQLLSGCGEFPSKEGRHFSDQLKESLENLEAQVDRLQNEGALAVMEEIHEGQKRAAQELEAMRIQSKRLKGKSYRDAVDLEKAPNHDKRGPSALDKPKSSEENDDVEMRDISFRKPTAKPTPSGQVPEVVIIRRRPSQSSSAPEQTSDDSEREADRPRRTTRRKAIVISDEEEEPVNVNKRKANRPKAKASKKKNTKRAKPRKSKSDGDEDYDYESHTDESSDDDNEESASASASSEDDAPKGKVKAKARAQAKPKGKGRASKSDTDMDVEELVKKTARIGVKRKASTDDDDDEPAPKKQKRTDSDPWKLQSKAVQKDWTQMQAPPLEIFHFSRTVVDEYTYLDGKIHALVTKLTADRHWVLSGTPPIHDFGALKTISAFLDIHLGIDDDTEGQSPEVKRRRKEQTGAEKFHSFREVHSLEWHAHRHALGQAFLDRYVRQNIAEIEEIPWTEKTVEITLPAAERAIYLELEHHLRALDMTIKRGKKTESDREKRLAQSLGDSKTAEEALLKRCSHFDLDSSSSKENAMKACDIIVQEREKQLKACKDELLQGLKAGIKREKAISPSAPQSLFHEWISNCRDGEVDDAEALKIVNDLIDEAGVGPIKAKPKKDDKIKELKEKEKAQIWEHREKTHELRRLAKELVGRVRSLRYFTVVRDLQRQREKPPRISCPSCGNDDLPISDIAVLSSCGHMGCVDCVKTRAENEECVYVEKGCKSAARILNIVKADTLGVDDVERDGRGKHFGMKLEKVVHIIKKEIPKDERVLIFAQFPDLMKKVTEALSYHKIEFLEIKGSASQKSKNLEKFQNGSEERVLLLNLMDESASGANLTSANHAIFLSPLLAPTKEIYQACEIQAVGRLVRYGQDKHVYVWRLRSKDTIDEEIYNQRKDVTMTSSRS